MNVLSIRSFLRLLISVVLRSLQTEYERVSSLKTDLEKQLEERVNELKTTKTVANSFTNQLKEKLEQMSAVKVKHEKGEQGSTADRSIFRLKSKTKMLDYVFKFKS